MVNEIRTIYPSRFNEGFTLNSVWAPEFDMKNLKKAEGCISQNIEYNNEDEDNNLNILRDKNILTLNSLL